VEIDTTIFRPATFIEMSLANLNRALLLGCVLVIVVLALFLMEWRSAVISITAIRSRYSRQRSCCTTAAAPSTRWCSPVWSLRSARL